MTLDLTAGKPRKLLIRYALPLIIGNFFQQLYNLADTAIVGKTLGKDALAAVGNTGSLSFLILGFVLGLTSGFSVLTAQRFGARDEDGLKKSVAATVILSIAFTLVITAISILTARPLLKLMQTPAQLLDMSYDYIIVIFAGIFAQVFYNAISNIVRSLGDSVTPLIFLLLSSALNIGLDFLFILGFKWGVAGAAWATVAAQLVAAAACLFYSLAKFKILRLNRKDFRVAGSFLWRHVAIGLPMALQFSITAIGCIVMQASINLFDGDAMAGFTAANKIEQIVSVVVMSFGAAMAVYVGQNYGAGRIDRIREGVRVCVWISLIASAISAAIVLIGGRWLVLAFVDAADTQVIRFAMEYFYATAAFYPALAMIFVYRNSVQAMGGSMRAMSAGVVELAARWVASVALVPLGFLAVCFSTSIAWVGAAVWLMACYYPLIKKSAAMFASKLEQRSDGALCTTEGVGACATACAMGDGATGIAPMSDAKKNTMEADENIFEGMFDIDTPQTERRLASSADVVHTAPLGTIGSTDYGALKGETAAYAQAAAVSDSLTDKETSEETKEN